jgi:hypothetical protein
LKKYKNLKNFIYYNLNERTHGYGPDYTYKRNKKLKKKDIYLGEWSCDLDFDGEPLCIKNAILVNDRYGIGNGTDVFGHPFQLNNKIKIGDLVSIDEIVYTIKFYCQMGCSLGTCLNLQEHSGFMGLDPI